MRRPTFFLSSTIFDFKDLRSAIKHSLEEQGCQVLASEFSDFKKPLDVHSYEACLKSLEHADFFILLIGSRVGGWFDAANRVSITQQEYRAAYELHKQGRLKILTFVRSEVWEFRDNYKALARHLEQLSLSDEQQTAIKRFPTKAVADAEFICKFLDEVGRNQETAAAVRDHGALPMGNWIHVFSGYRDIVDVIRPLVFDGIPLEQAAIRRIVRHEMIGILRMLLIKGKNGAYSPTQFIARIIAANPIGMGDRETAYVSFVPKDWDMLSSALVHTMGRNLTTRTIESAITSSAFIEFDTNAQCFRESPVFLALVRLRDEVDFFNRATASEVYDAMFEHSPRARGGKDKPVNVKPLRALLLFNLAMRWANCILLSTAILKHLEGGVFEMPTLLSKSPVKGMDEEIANETVSSADVESFLRK